MNTHCEGTFDELMEIEQAPPIMRLAKVTLVVLAAFLVAAPLQAAEREHRTLSLQECFRIALENNLDIQVERFGPEIATFNYEGARGAYDPSISGSFRDSSTRSPGGTDPRGFVTATDSDSTQYSTGLSGLLPSGMTYNVGPSMTRQDGTRFLNGAEYSGSVGLSVTQPLLKNSWIDNARQQILVARKNREISEFSVENQIITILTRVEQVYYELIFALESVKVQQAALGLAEKLLEENKKRVQVGAMAPLDEKQAESQVAARKADLLEAQRAVETQQNNLRNLLTDNYTDWHEVRIAPSETLVAVEEDMDVQESWRKGMAQRPDLLQARKDIERRDIILKYQRNQTFPQLDLQATYGHNALGTDAGAYLTQAADGRSPRYSIGLVFSVPLNNRDAKNRYQATRAEKMQALLRLKKQEQDVIVQIDEAINLARTTFERIDATKAARQYAEAALDAEEKKLANGKSTSFVVLQLQRDLTNARSSEIRALADYRKALAGLAQARGGTLERNKLSLEVK